MRNLPIRDFTRTGFGAARRTPDTQTVNSLRVFAGVIGAVVILSAPAGVSTDGSGTREISSRAALGRGIVSEINALRAKRSLPRLVVSAQLATAARTHSHNMAHAGFFAHDSASGSFAERIQRYYRSSGFRSWRAGENLLWASPDIDAKRAVEMWLESPGHRHILLTPAWREIGLSAVHTVSAPREFDGLEVTIVTADFGARVR
jgi:uncharacterized protein YkwD